MLHILLAEFHQLTDLVGTAVPVCRQTIKICRHARMVQYCWLAGLSRRHVVSSNELCDKCLSEHAALAV